VKETLISLLVIIRVDVEFSLITHTSKLSLRQQIRGTLNSTTVKETFISLLVIISGFG